MRRPIRSAGRRRSTLARRGLSSCLRGLCDLCVLCGSMKSESIAFGIAGVVFGLIAGWVIGAQQATTRAPAAAAAQSAAAPAGNGAGTRAAVLDETQAQALKSVAEREPSNPAPRSQLGNMYF